MTDRQLGLQRLSIQRIIGEKFTQPDAVVRWMGAIQAQEYHQAVWAIGLRMQSARLANIEQSIAEGKIIRTWPMRGTIHFIPAPDAGWMLRLSAERMLAKDRRRQEQLGLDGAVLERSLKIWGDALQGGRRFTRQEMLTLLENAGIPTQNQRGYHILWYAALKGLICMGPMQEKQQTFVLLDDWAPNARTLSREEALGELASRYFASHGPASLRDFAWWAGLPLSEARLGLEAASPGLVAITSEGSQYWLAGDAPDLSNQEPPGVQLLPGFDEYLMGYTDRSAVLAKEHAARIVPGGNGVFYPMLVAAGQVAGSWKRTLKKNAVEISVSPFTQLDVPEESVLQAARSYCAFLEKPLSTFAIETDE